MGLEKLGFGLADDWLREYFKGKRWGSFIVILIKHRTIRIQLLYKNIKFNIQCTLNKIAFFK